MMTHSNAGVEGTEVADEAHAGTTESYTNGTSFGGWWGRQMDSLWDAPLLLLLMQGLCVFFVYGPEVLKAILNENPEHLNCHVSEIQGVSRVVEFL